MPRRRRQFGEDVADGVEMRVVETKLAEAGEEPGGAGGFGERRSRDGEQLQLPAAELRLVQMEPLEGAVDAAVGGEGGDAGQGS